MKLTMTRVLWAAGWLLFATMLVHLGALLVTGDTWSGPVSLRKPLDFAESGWLVTWSVALVLPVLRTRRWQRGVIGGTAILFGVGETAIMAIEAWRGVPSHYNFSTPFDAALMRGAAAGTAGVFIIGVVIMLVAATRTADLPPALRLGIVAGVATLFVGCAIGFIMVSNNSGVFQGTIGKGFGNRSSAYLGPSAATVGPDYLVLRPETAGGDLLLPHAIGVHGLVLLAVPAVLLARTGLDAVRQVRIVAVAAGAIGIALAVLLVQAFRQRPLDHLGPVQLALLAVCLLALAGSYLALLVHLNRKRGNGHVLSGGEVSR